MEHRQTTKLTKCETGGPACGGNLPSHALPTALMYLLAALAVLGTTVSVPVGEWTIMLVDRAPWAAGSPDVRWTGKRLTISDKVVSAPQPYDCSNAQWDVVQLPAEGLFQGNLPLAGAAEIARTLHLPLPATTYRLTCSSGSFDFHRTGDGLITALSDDLLRLEQHNAAYQRGDWRLTPTGLGPVRIGMTPGQVTKALGTPLTYDAGALEIGEDCSEASTSTLPGAWFMFEQGKLTRMSLRSPSTLTTPRGIAPGSSEAEVRMAYGRGLKASPHEYEAPPAKYFTFWTEPRRTGVRFEIDHAGVVEAVHAGTRSIEYVEGCA